MKSDLEISRNAKVERIEEIARMLGFSEEDIIKYGDYIAKVKLSVWNRIKNNRNGKYVVVTGITPTPLGEGKTHYNHRIGTGAEQTRKEGSCVYKATHPWTCFWNKRWCTWRWICPDLSLNRV